MDRPNIVLFLTDDHGAWALGSAGNREIVSPNLDALAHGGVRFANAFTPSPVCSPARACLLTGLTPSQIGIHDWIQEVEPVFGDRDWLTQGVTLPELLRDAGYYCGLSGKWHLGQSHLTPRGFDWYFGLPRWQGNHIETYSYVFNGEERTLSGNKTRFIADHALEFLQNRPASQPFFLQIGFIATHSPWNNQEPELVARYQDATFEDIPRYLPHPWRKNEGFPADDSASPEDVRRRYRNYYAAVTDIDTQVGRVMEWLRQNNRLENTLVIYTSDHGLALGHGGFWGKGNSTRPLNMYEVSLRIPLLLHWPGSGVVGGRTINHLVDHYDTFQTICDVAGAQTVGGINYPGHSFKQIAQGDEQPDWRETRFGEYSDLRMIRRPQFKYVWRYPDGPHSLFDLQRDADEQTNLSGAAAWAPVAAELQAELTQWYTQFDAAEHSGLLVKALPQHNRNEAWRDGIREARGMQVY